ncbi:helix-turn-helix domain-containing protein [Tenacibaculum sp. ZH5_bin.1]|uniref:helix-turn-helix domain-containing protein n=1 Tax=Tenacibaculum TaxID=104267 RepID=UPI00142F8D2E|nr:helix-turn-helix domain-containing protein [Tenacibaculum mesophilum]KAF9659141.1 AraC family transcriptional regulator [Tenacibaculum mesophilum]
MKNKIKTHKKQITLFFFLFLFISSFGQSKVDTLSSKTMEELFFYYEKSEKKEDKISYIKAFLKVAKRENNRQRIAAGYYMLSGLYNDERVLKYSDSVINLMSNKSIKHYPSWSYLTKAYYYQDNYQYDDAIDNYLLAIKYAKEHNNEPLIISTKYSIGGLKRKLKMYDEAAILVKENLEYAQKNNLQKRSLMSIIELANLYTESKQVDSVQYYIKIGKKLSLKLKDTLMYHHLNMIQGIVECHKKNYSLALNLLEKEEPFFIEKKLNNYLTYIYFYIGKSFEGINEENNKIKAYKKVDSLFQLEKPIFPFVREAYESLINKYKQENDLKKQLLYINKLIKYDSIINYNERYLNRKIYREYDIPKLKSEKEIVIKQMKKNKIFFHTVIVVISLVVVLLLVLFIYQYHKKRVYKQRFEEIINSKKIVKDVKTKKENINIPKQIRETILEELNEFEIEQKFITNNITLSSLAKDLNTNTQYLSKVVNYYKDKSFSTYLSDLRISYIVERLKKDGVLRKYTVKAIAKEAGFNNAESFSKAFYNLNGIKPSYFLKELEKKGG